MPTPAPLKRLYNGADPTMRQDMRTMQQHFLTYQSDFATLNPTFATPFETDWLTALDAADQAPPDYVRRGELRDDTQDVEAVMAQARTAVQRVFYYVGEAFPDRPGHLEQYGKSQYDKAATDHARMHTLLAQAFDNATRDKKALAAKGYDAKQLAALGTLAQQLTTTDTTQETTKGTNQDGTADYITLQNTAYRYGQQVNKAALQVFATDAAKLGLFRLGSGARSRPAGLEGHALTVHVGQRKAMVFKAPFGPASRLRLHLSASKPGQSASVGRVAAPTDAPTRPAALAHAAPDLEVPAADLGAAGQYLVVQNTGTGTVRVEVALL